jgi:hypothetical protein
VADVVLLHGAWCGPWYWTEVIDALGDRGLTAVGPDLPAGDRGAGLEEYVAAATAGVPPDDAPVVVGHSLAGMLLEPLAAARRVRHLVYLAAFIPMPGVSLRQQWRTQREMLSRGWNRGIEMDAHGTSRWVDPDAAIDVLFQDCDGDVARRAAAHLRPQAWHVSDVPFSGEHVTPRSYVTAADDRLLDSAWHTDAARTVLGTEPVRLPGGHSPMLSRPRDLAGVLAEIAA